MNNNIVKELTTTLNNISKASQTKEGKKKRKGKKGRRRRRGGQETQSAGSNNPLTRNGLRGPVGQSLTSVQFTATSPLNLFTSKPASTPGGVRMRGREVIGIAQVVGAGGGFQIANITRASGSPANYIAVHPGVCPRLSSIAAVYEFYKFHSFTAVFQSYQATTASGMWMGMLEYDYRDRVPSSTIQFLSNISSVTANIYSDMSLVLDGSLSRLDGRSKFQCSTDALTGDNNQIYQGYISIASDGFTSSPTATTDIGLMIWDYDIEFYTPSEFHTPATLEATEPTRMGNTGSSSTLQPVIRDSKNVKGKLLSHSSSGLESQRFCHCEFCYLAK